MRSEVILIRDSRELARGCLICGASIWDCTVDGCLAAKLPSPFEPSPT
ncbi:MAG TPA: hypothetical protein VMT24_09165 [Aggregatilineaceae bacterium]|nr:hypothetical protein [Aggregatilineaceae bacterium]